MNIKILILACLAIAFLLSKDNNNSKKNYICVSCLLFAIESGLRNLSVGQDTERYYFLFWVIDYCDWKDILIPFMNFAAKRDPGYSILIKFVTTIFKSWQFYLILSSAFLYVSLGKLWNRYIETKHGVFFASILWLALFDIIALSGMRQMITMALAFYMTSYIECRKWRIVIPAIIVGAFIHISILFMTAFIPLSFLNKEKLKILLFVAIAVVPIIGSFSGAIMGWMANYLENEYYHNYAQQVEGAVGYTYVILCTTLSAFILYEYQLIKDAPNFFLIAAILMTTFVPLILRGGTAIRIGQYFTVYMMLSIPYIMERIKRRNLIYGIMTVTLIVNILFASQNNYLFCWESSSGYIYGY